jgi:hypothetical protein
MNERYPTVFFANNFDYTLDTTSYPTFYQQITSENKFIEITFHNNPDNESDYPHAWTNLTDTISGNLHIWVDKDSSYVKTYKAVSKVRGFFEKMGSSSDSYRGWVMVRFVTGNVIEDDATISFNTLVIKTSTGFDTLWYPSSIVDFAHKDSTMLRFYKGDTVTFKLTPVETNDFIYYLHIGEDGNFKKIPFVNQGDSVLVASWTATTNPDVARGYKHAFISLTRRSSIESDTSAYKFRCWGVLYRIR